ncbi:GNAT family N-acetyltransferase [Nocardia inohanensis]|uniref:GNAT family N-acetyltransferase n=1 Tax=Nocardia inohanensis TaxID=209246 RepID=UPI00082AF741|nr:GNAT family N-acetyltransferase [Nocardia inohanensis]
MQNQPLVRRAQLSEADEVARVFARAAVDEVVTAWILDDHPEVQERFRTDHAPEMIEKALTDDEVWIAGTDSEIWAVSIWQTLASPERAALEAEQTRNLAEELPLQPFRRMAALTSILAGTHPADYPYRYLQVIVTLPEHRGKGAGHAIITDRVKAASADGLPAYLEASTDRSARLYQRCGFEISGPLIPLPENGPTLRPMWFRG